MSLPGVNVSFQNGQLGKVDDPGAGIPGMIVLMASAPTDHAFGVAKSYSSYDDLPEELQALDEVSIFFDEAPYYTIWIMPVSSTYTVADILDYTSENKYAYNLAKADDDIRFIGIVGAQVATADIATAGLNAKTCRAALKSDYRYVRFFMSVAYDSDLPDLGEADYEGVGFICSATTREVGTFLGRRAIIRVQRNVGRVKDGALSVSSAQLVDGTDITDDMDKVSEVYDKRYISLRTYVGKSGYYFTNDVLAVPSTDDYATDGLRAVIDKAAILAYETYVDEINDDVETDDDGTISTAAAKEIQGLIETAIDDSMTSNDEISSCSAYVDETQDIVSNGKLTVVVGITPRGYLNEITVELGFDVD